MLKIIRRFGNTYKFTYEKVVSTCKEISELNSDSLATYFGHKENMQNFFNTIPKKVKSMQTVDINSICASLSKFKHIQDLSPMFWENISQELCKRSKDLELEEIIEIVSIFSHINADSGVIKTLFNSLGKELEEFDYSDYKLLHFHQLEQLLASYSLKNVGSSTFYQILSELLIARQEFKDIAYQHLAKLAYYFSRANMAKRKSMKFIKVTEETLWNAIHQGKITEMEEITGIISYIIPGNIGSNELRALLEFTLFRFLADPTNQITISRLSEVITAFTHYIITYKPLDMLLKQLVKDSIDSLNSKELIQILWAYCRHNKAELEFVNLLITRCKEILLNKTLPFRHFTYLMNSVANTGINDPGVIDFIDSYCVKSLDSQYIQDHYLVKALSLVKNSKFLDRGVQELMNPARLLSTHPKDITRAVVLISENPSVQSEEVLNYFNAKISDAARHMKAQHIARCIYSLSRLNRGSPKAYSLLESKMLEHDLTKMMPVDLGVSCLGFGLVGMSNFCSKAASAVNDCFHKYQKREYEDYSDTDQEDIIENKLILVNEQDLDFTSELPASSVVQMAWMVATLEIDDKTFWNSKLVSKLKSISLTSNPYTLNQWLWTAKTLREEEDFITGVDSFHYGLLRQVLNFVTDDYQELDYQFSSNSKEFIDDVAKYAKILSASADLRDQSLWINDKKIFLYENQHFVYQTPGYFKQIDHENLLGTARLQKIIHQKKDIQFAEIFKGHWIGMTPLEKTKHIEKILNT